MKRLSITAIASLLALAGCGEEQAPAEQPDNAADTVTVPVEGEGWTPDESKPGDVEVNLPETRIDYGRPEKEGPESTAP